jgi:hypothetical protein
MSSLHFRHEMLIPDRNGDIYLSVYEIENWLRRICLTSCMIKYGQDWPSQINDHVAKALKRRLDRNRELFCLGAETDSNLIWPTMHGELHNLLLDQEIWPVVEKLTKFGRERLVTKLHELKDFRNLLAHNRAFSSHTEIIFRGLETAIKAGIENFKNAILYSDYDIVPDKDPDPVNVLFQRHMTGNNCGKFQAFLAKNDFFHQFVCLPVKRKWDPAYVSGYKMLQCYRAYLDLVVAFTINKTADEYCVLIPRNTPLDEAEEVWRLFTSNPDVWTMKPFTEQAPQYITHPKLWFYENRRPVPE